MTDSEVEEFARILVEHSTEIKEGDNVYLIAESLDSLPLFEELRRQIIRKGAFPHEHLLYDSQVGSEGMDYDWMKYASEKQLETVSEAKKKEMQEMDAYIRVGGPDNTQELAGIDSKKISLRKNSTREIFYERDEKKWVTTRWPTDGLAQSSDMSTQELREYILNAVTNVNWKKLKKRNQKIKKKFDSGSKVRITGKKTDITFSIESRKGVNCYGKRNVPDGEVFYAPVKNTVNGQIKFTFPGISNGNKVKDIELEFENGKVIKYHSETNKNFLENMINTDRGSKYIGEFGIGTNREMGQYIGNSLLDEKIFGTVHLALGRAYKRSMPDGKKGNDSGIHWDLVKDLREKGKLILDGETVFEDGDWCLNHS
ncbi:MAG: aminopeptidase [Candidatus Nanosalina sp.]